MFMSTDYGNFSEKRFSSDCKEAMENLCIKIHHYYYFHGINSLVCHHVEISPFRGILCVIAYCHLQSIHLSLQEHIFIFGFEISMHNTSVKGK